GPPARAGHGPGAQRPRAAAGDRARRHPSRAARGDPGRRRHHRGGPRMAATAAPRDLNQTAGIATRGLALAVDAAIANLIVLVLAALIGLIGSLAGDLRPKWLVAALAAAGWAVVVGGYFTLFWAATGQTPGMRLMRLKVTTYTGAPLHLMRAL